MPYVSQELRNPVDKEINALIEKLKTLDVTQIDGEVNYTITRIVDAIYGKGGYFVYNRFMGVVIGVLLEFYRRRIAPYEDKKIQENGDVY